MQYNINIPLEELFEPLQQLYGQVGLYENVVKLMSQKDKDRIKKKWVIDKIKELQGKEAW